MVEIMRKLFTVMVVLLVCVAAFAKPESSKVEFGFGFGKYAFLDSNSTSEKSMSVEFNSFSKYTNSPVESHVAGSISMPLIITSNGNNYAGTDIYKYAMNVEAEFGIGYNFLKRLLQNM